MNSVVSLLVLVALAQAAINLFDSNPNCPGARVGEKISQCGRLCEVNCRTIGEDLAVPLPLVLDGPQEEQCTPAMYCDRPNCLQGLIYDPTGTGVCVTQTPLSCRKCTYKVNFHSISTR
jgi:hypothetical protein